MNTAYSCNVSSCCCLDSGSFSSEDLRLDFSCCNQRPKSKKTAAVHTKPEIATADESLEVISISSVETPDSSQVETREPSPVELADPETRLYVVWKFKERAISWPGIHFGPSRAAIDGLNRLNGGSFDGLEWQQVSTRQHAEELFASHAAQFQVISSPINYYAWSRET